MKRGRMTSSIVLVASENQAPRHQRGASDLISIEPVTSSLGRFSPHGGADIIYSESIIGVAGVL